MVRTVTIKFRLTRELWRTFYEAHYTADRSLKIRYFWGVVCIVLGSSGFGGLYEAPLVAGLLLATGFFGVLSKPIFLARSMRSVEKHPFLGQELTVNLTTEGVIVRSGLTGYDQPWSNFSGYRKVAAGYILYLEQGAFFFVPEQALTSEKKANLDHILATVGLKPF